MLRVLHPFLYFLIVSLFPVTSLAGDGEEVPASGNAVVGSEVVDPFASDALVQLVLGLVFVIGLILVVAWVAKRVMGVQQAGRHMRIITGLPLGTREKIVLVQVGKEQLLLGVAPGRVSLLSRFDEPVAEISAEQGDFAQKVREALQRREGA